MKKIVFATLLLVGMALMLLPTAASADVTINPMPDPAICDYTHTTVGQACHVRAYSVVDGGREGEVGGEIIRMDTGENFQIGGRRHFKAVPAPGYKFVEFKTWLYKEAYNNYRLWNTPNVRCYAYTPDSVYIFSFPGTPTVKYDPSGGYPDRIQVNRRESFSENKAHPLYLTVMAVFEPFTYSIRTTDTAGVTLYNLPASAKYDRMLQFGAEAAAGYDFSKMQVFCDGKLLEPYGSSGRMNYYRITVRGETRITSSITATPPTPYYAVYSTNWGQTDYVSTQQGMDITLTFDETDEYHVFREWVFKLPNSSAQAVNPGASTWKYLNYYDDASTAGIINFKNGSSLKTPSITFSVANAALLKRHNALGGNYTLMFWAEDDYRLKIKGGVFTDDDTYDIATAHTEKVYSSRVDTFIRANDPPEGMEFDRWMSPNNDESLFEDITDPTTAFHYSGGAATNLITATYKLCSAYDISVTDGVVSGEFNDDDGRGPGQVRVGECVTITADPPAEGERFKEWTIQPDVTFVYGDKNTATATFIMPAEDVAASAVTALKHTLTLPSSLTQLDDEAFMGSMAFDEVLLPNEITRIGNRAFSGCSSLMEIYIPGPVLEIGEDAFAGCESLTIYAPAGGIAEQYATANGIRFADTSGIE